MKILVGIVFYIFGIWTLSFAQPGEGVKRATNIDSEINQILAKKECLAIKNRLTNILNKIAAANPNDANKVSLGFEEEMKNMVAKGELPRHCYQEIFKALDQKKLKAIPPETEPGKAPAPAATAIGPPGQAKAANETKEPDSPQTAKPESVPVTLDKKKPTPTSPLTGKVADGIKKGAGISAPSESGKAAEGLRKGANSTIPNRPVTGPLTNAKRVKGTGNTTGHIADLTFENSSNSDLEIEMPNMFIPSINNLQPYIVPAAKTVVVPPNSEITIPLIGYCVDITKPPVPAGEDMPPITDWIEKDSDLYDQNGIIPDKLYDYWGIPDQDSGMSNSEDFPIKFINVTSETPGSGPFVSNHISTNPDSRDEGSTKGIPSNDFKTVIIPRENIDLAIPLLFDALEKITSTTDSLMHIGEINTPFSGNSVREKESIIQQTVWLYSSTLVGDPYEKEQFEEKLIEQYEKASGTNFKSAPVQLKENIEQGVDDFWNTFTLVGIEAKILSDKPIEFTPIPHKEKMEDVFGKHSPDHIKPHTDTANEALDKMGAEAHAPGDIIPKESSKEPSKELLQHELVHSEQNQKSKSIKRMTPEDLARFEDKLVLDPQKPKKEKCPPPVVKMTVESFKGNEILIQLPDGTDLDSELIVAGTEIPENSTIETGENTELIVNYAICQNGKLVNHSGCKFREMTNVRIDKLFFSHPNVVQSVQLNQGEIRIKVTDDRQNYETDIKVATPNAVSSVSGTEFIVRVNSDIEEILVVEGCVDVLKTDATISQKVCSGDKFIIK